MSENLPENVDDHSPIYLWSVDKWTKSEWNEAFGRREPFKVVDLPKYPLAAVVRVPGKTRDASQ